MTALRQSLRTHDQRIFGDSQQARDNIPAHVSPRMTSDTQAFRKAKGVLEQFHDTIGP